MTLVFARGRRPHASSSRTIYGFRIRRVGPDDWQVTDRQAAVRGQFFTFTQAKIAALKMADDDERESVKLLA